MARETTTETASLISDFCSRFNTSMRPRVFRGPGRVNLIGEHTDYNLGFVLPMALELACFTAAGPNGEGKLRVFSNNAGEGREWAISQLPQLERSGHWSDYVVGVAVELLRSGYEIVPTGLLIDSTVPEGSGLSSSAALEVSTALALLGGRPVEPLDLALLCRRAENHFVGTPCGIMDQYVSVFGREHAAIEIDCRSLTHETVSLPENVEIVAVNTMVKHELGQSAYRQRVQECAEAARIIGVESLRDASIRQFQAAGGSMPETVFKRARHVVTEDERVKEFAEASRQGDLARMGELFVASHRSLQHDYEVSCEELDFLVDTALKIPGVYGARMTGGGFGGCTVNLMKPGTDFAGPLAAAYKQRFGIEAQFYPCRPSAGASEFR